MLTQERHDRIRAQLANRGKVIATDLAEEFGVSEDTVRRDLRELARTGECRRVYGGALLPAPDLGSIQQRSGTMSEAKTALAQRVVDLIDDEQTMFIDAGSTNLAIAHALPRDKAITVVTNAPNIAVALSDHPRCKTIVLGGIFNAEKGACLGGQTIRDARRIYADLFVLGTCGVDSVTGITSLDAEEAELKHCLVEQSGRLIVAATIDKIGTIAPYKVAEPSEVDVLVAQDAMDAKQVALFEAQGIKVQTVPT